MTVDVQQNRDAPVYGEEYNPYSPPGTRLESAQSRANQKLMLFWRIYLVIYIALPFVLLFSEDVIKLFKYGNSEIILYTVKAHFLVETLNWLSFIITIIGLIGFMWERRILTRSIWVVTFWLCGVWTVGYYVYEAYREFSSANGGGVLVELGFTLFNFTKNMIYAVPALYAMYSYCYRYPWIWREPKQ